VRLLRSWPAQIPSGRNYVNDQIERFVMGDYRYDGLADLDDDILLVEWDTAFGPEDLERFTEFALADPGRVAVAPYRLYVTSIRNQPLPKPVWVHRYDTNRHVDEGDPFCHWFGLGMTYLPRELIRLFMLECRRRNWAEGLNDCTFSMWHWRVTKRQVPICWGVRPVHLHYQLSTP
jgi:hypothetical protein